MFSIVAVDLETTGLDPDRNEIIEIAGVRFKGNRVEAEWESLIRPRRAIPPEITRLTGISNAMVANAPMLSEVIQEFADFVGHDPVLGHNVQFDLGFLRRKGVLLDNYALDTYALAAVLLPTAGRYNLGALGQLLGIPFPATHRAMDDARLTHAIYHNLYQLALSLPLELVADIVRMGEQLEWGGGFEAVMQDRSRETIRPRRARSGSLGPLFDGRGAEYAAPVEPLAEYHSLDPEEVAAVLEHGGEFSRYFPNFEFRPQQVEMVKAVTEALSVGRHLLVEAGTGTGKSMAYLIPAALWAAENNTRVVISTNTINLQDQLIHKDIPDLSNALGVEVRATVLKGRSNYLCPRRLEAIRRRGPENAAEMRVLAKILVWLLEAQSGDRSEINLTGPQERAVWARLSAEDEGCTSDTCYRRMGGICPFYQAHRAAHSAHLIVVNHALLLADVATGNRVLPEYNYLIVDEGHHIEAATTNALSYRVTETDTERLLRELGGSKTGLLGRSLTLTQDVLPPDKYAYLDRLVQNATDLAFHFQNLSRQFFITVNAFLEDQREGRKIGPYGHKERILPATRAQPAWTDIEMVWEDAEANLRSLLDAIEQIGQVLAELVESGLEEIEDTYSSLASLYRRLTELNDNLNGMVFEPSDSVIYWAEIRGNNNRLSLQAAPLHIGPLMQEHLWHQKETMVLTSATLTAAGEFDYLRTRLYAEDAYELALGSPFDYESATLLYLVNNIPEPSDRQAYQRALNQVLIQLCKETGGRALVLFTSYAQLQQTSRAISPALAEADIHVFEQGTGASPHALLETFRDTEQAVLLGTRAFWEGVDVPGDALSVLVIAKLPFDVPSDPIIAARSETFEDPFYQYALPEAILRFRQGFGRLIRTQQDRGIVVILDRRVLTKQYGRAFVESLPECTVHVGPMEDVKSKAASWLNL